MYSSGLLVEVWKHTDTQGTNSDWSTDSDSSDGVGKPERLIPRSILGVFRRPRGPEKMFALWLILRFQQ